MDEECEPETKRVCRVQINSSVSKLLSGDAFAAGVAVGQHSASGLFPLVSACASGSPEFGPLRTATCPLGSSDRLTAHARRDQTVMSNGQRDSVSRCLRFAPKSNSARQVAEGFWANARWGQRGLKG